MQNKKTDQPEKARLGAIGENNVVSLLMQHGWDAFNANCTIKNFKSIDVVCLKREEFEKPKTAFVQVKTCVQKNIPIGFTIGQCLDKEYLEKMVMGPYVFVSANLVEKQFSFRYFVLSRKKFIELAYQSHCFYVKGYNREKEVSLNSLAGLNVRWLEGLSDNQTKNHRAFDNPLNGISCENKWEDIWEE